MLNIRLDEQHGIATLAPEGPLSMGDFKAPTPKNVSDVSPTAHWKVVLGSRLPRIALKA